MPWTYTYSLAAQCDAVKLEPEWDDGGESETASQASLYADPDHNGPENLQPQDIDILVQPALTENEDSSCAPEPTDEARAELATSPIPPEDPLAEKILQQLTHCFVRLERIDLDKQHTSSLSSHDKPFKCSLCDKQFTQKISLEVHAAWHRKLSCHICQRKFSNQHCYNSHVQKHKVKPHHCNICHKLFEQPSELANHRLEHTRDPFFCDICQKSLKSRQGLAFHVTVKHEGNPQGVLNVNFKPEVCSICYEKCMSKSALQIHMRIHQKPKDNKGEHQTGNEPEINQTTSALSSKCERYLSKRRSHCCTICPRRFVFKIGLINHMRMHSRVKLVEQTPQLSSLEPAPALKDSYGCDICHQQFVSTKLLLTHTQSQHPIAVESNTLLPPQRIKKPHVCQICAPQRGKLCLKLFLLKANLKVHMQKVHGMGSINTPMSHEKPHGCHICQRRYWFEKSLTTHMRLQHQQPNKRHIDKPKRKLYCCEACQMTFTRKIALFNHMKSRHPKPIESNNVQTRHGKADESNNIEIRHPKSNESNSLTNLTHFTFEERDQEHPDNKSEHQHTDDASNIHVIKPFTFYKREHTANKFIKQIIPPSICEDNVQEHTDNESNIHVIQPSSFDKSEQQHKDDESNKQVTPPFIGEVNVQKHANDNSNNHVMPPFGFVKSEQQNTDDESNNHAKSPFSFVKSEQQYTNNESSKHITLPSNFCKNDQRDSKEQLYKQVTMLSISFNSLYNSEDIKVESIKQVPPSKYDRGCSKANIYTCNICLKRFAYEETLVRHIQQHRPKKSIEKIYKGQQSQGLPKLQIHCCDVCKKRFAYEDTLLTHMQQHSDKATHYTTVEFF